MIGRVCLLVRWLVCSLVRSFVTLVVISQKPQVDFHKKNLAQMFSMFSRKPPDFGH